jgi:leucyl/phenylalanyl-tRNA--protein transferase
MQRLCWIDPHAPDDTFPDVRDALQDPDGLLAVGGDLSPSRLIEAYRRGIFPWYGQDQPILWWSPDPRTVLFPEHLKISRSLRKTLRKEQFYITLDQTFRRVVEACAEPRRDQSETWITREMIEAYCRLHEAGVAHSVESWCGDELVGGLYGIAIGRVFFGESMFSRRTDASKVAFVHLVRKLQSWEVVLIDCQVRSEHLISLGAIEIPRYDFTLLLDKYCNDQEGPKERGFSYERSDSTGTVDCIH